jgi:hypothetical protein
MALAERSCCRAVALALLLVVCGCSTPAPTPAAVPQADASHDSVGFINRVWSVRSSTAVSPGTIYVFVSDGTLLITSPHSTPVVGKWTRQDDVFTMIEEGLPYRTELLHLSRDEFRIRSHNPGQPVETTLVPAEVPPLSR